MKTSSDTARLAKLGSAHARRCYAARAQELTLWGNPHFDRAAIEMWHELTGLKHPRARQAKHNELAGAYAADGMLLVVFRTTT